MILTKTGHLLVGDWPSGTIWEVRKK